MPALAEPSSTAAATIAPFMIGILKKYYRCQSDRFKMFGMFSAQPGVDERLMGCWKRRRRGAVRGGDDSDDEQGNGARYPNRATSNAAPATAVT